METVLRVHRPAKDHRRRPRRHPRDAAHRRSEFFTSRYMGLPHSSTMWLPGDDAVGHYRSTFRYDLLRASASGMRHSAGGSFWRGAGPLVEMLGSAGLPSAHSRGNWTIGQAGGSPFRAGGSPLVGAWPIVEMLEDAEPPSVPLLQALPHQPTRESQFCAGGSSWHSAGSPGSVAREGSATGEAFRSRSSRSLKETPPGGPQTIRRLSASRCHSPKIQNRRISDSSDARGCLLESRAFICSLHFLMGCSINCGVIGVIFDTLSQSSKMHLY